MNRDVSNILIVAPSGGLDVASLGPLPTDAVLTVVSWEAAARAQSGVGTVIAVPPRRGRLAALRMRLRAPQGLIMRSLVRLSPFDEGVWFWSSASRDAAARSAVRTADLIVALNRDAVYAASRWQRRLRAKGVAVPAVLGYPAARLELAKVGGR